MSVVLNSNSLTRLSPEETELSQKQRNDLNQCPRIRGNLKMTPCAQYTGNIPQAFQSSASRAANACSARAVAHLRISKQELAGIIVAGQLPRLDPLDSGGLGFAYSARNNRAMSTWAARRAGNQQLAAAAARSTTATAR